MKTGQELRRITAAAPRLVFVERDLPRLRRPGHVEPHITFRLGVAPRLMENLQDGFVRVENLQRNQNLMQFVIQRLQDVRARENPVRHDLPGQEESLPFPVLFLTVQGDAHEKLLRHDMRHGFGEANPPGMSDGFFGVSTMGTSISLTLQFWQAYFT